MKLLLPITVILMLANCSRGSNKITFIMCSKSKNIIDSVKVRGYGFEETFRNLQYTNEFKRVVDVYNPNKGEGAFVILIFQKDSIPTAQSFGYYSDPASIKNTYKICILNDLSIKEEISPDL